MAATKITVELDLVKVFPFLDKLKEKNKLIQVGMSAEEKTDYTDTLNTLREQLLSNADSADVLSNYLEANKVEVVKGSNARSTSLVAKTEK